MPEAKENGQPGLSFRGAALSESDSILGRDLDLASVVTRVHKVSCVDSRERGWDNCVASITEM